MVVKKNRQIDEEKQVQDKDIVHAPMENWTFMKKSGKYTGKRTASSRNSAGQTGCCM